MKLKTEEDIKGCLEHIKSIASDDEVAHNNEDNLHQEVLALIAKGKCPDPRRWAKLALKTQSIDFARWCA